MNRCRRGGTFILLAALLTGAFLVTPADAQKSKRRPSKPAVGAPADEVIATVNGEKITRAQIAEDLLADQISRLGATNPQFADRQRPVAASIGVLLLNRMRANGWKPVTLSRPEIIDWLFKDKPQIVVDAVQNKIREVVIRQEAARKKIKVTPGEIGAEYNRRINSVRQQFSQLLQGKSDTEVLAAFGARPEALRNAIQVGLVVDKLVRAELETKLGHPLGPGDFLEASHILVRPINAPPVTPSTPSDGNPPAAPSQEDREKSFNEARVKLLGYIDEIKSGKKTFEQAAQDYTDDGATKFRQGKLGVFLRGQMVPEFDKAAFSMDPGQLSEPVRTPFGWHVLRVDRLGKDIPETEREQALQTYIRSRVQGYIQELVQKAKVTNRLGPLPMMPGPGTSGG